MTTNFYSHSYANLSEYKAWIAVRGLVGSVGTDASDDLSIEIILKGVSRYIEQQTGRHFAPYIETRYYDLPPADTLESRVLRLDDDLLEIITLTNGNGTVIPSTEYNLHPRNRSPHYGIRLDDDSIYSWVGSGTGSTHGVIAVYGIWGYHNRYAQAWATGTTTSEDLDISEEGISVAASTVFSIYGVGSLVRFDNELGYLISVGGATLITCTRGENYSTPATHASGITVHLWNTQSDIKDACLMIAQNVYGLRSGQSGGGKITVSAAGVVIRPEEVPPLVQKTLMGYRDIT